MLSDANIHKCTVILNENLRGKNFPVANAGEMLVNAGVLITC